MIAHGTPDALVYLVLFGALVVFGAVRLFLRSRGLSRPAATALSVILTLAGWYAIFR